MLSAMQVEHGLKKGEITYLAVMIEVKEDKFVEVLDAIIGLLEEFVDVIPPELPKTFPPRCVVDHKIKLVPGSKPHSKAPYRMSPMELAEIESNCLSCLMQVTFSPLKLLIVLQFCFKKSKMAHCECV